MMFETMGIMMWSGELDRRSENRRKITYAYVDNERRIEDRRSEQELVADDLRRSGMVVR